MDKKSYRKINTYNIGYVVNKNIDDSQSINSVNHLYLIISTKNGYIEEKMEVNS